LRKGGRNHEGCGEQQKDAKSLHGWISLNRLRCTEVCAGRRLDMFEVVRHS
jgi:hypothetical protein